jgi:hypothetical protein
VVIRVETMASLLRPRKHSSKPALNGQHAPFGMNHFGCTSSYTLSSPILGGQRRSFLKPVTRKTVSGASVAYELRRLRKALEVRSALPSGPVKQGRECNEGPIPSVSKWFSWFWDSIPGFVGLAGKSPNSSIPVP